MHNDEHRSILGRGARDILIELQPGNVVYYVRARGKRGTRYGGARGIYRKGHMRKFVSYRPHRRLHA